MSPPVTVSKESIDAFALVTIEVKAVALTSIESIESLMFPKVPLALLSNVSKSEIALALVAMLVALLEAKVSKESIDASASASLVSTSA